MKIKDIRNLSSEELVTELDRLRRHLFEVRAQAVTEKLENPTLIDKAPGHRQDSDGAARAADGQPNPR